MNNIGIKKSLYYKRIIVPFAKVHILLTLVGDRWCIIEGLKLLVYSNQAFDKARSEGLYIRLSSFHPY